MTLYLARDRMGYRLWSELPTEMEGGVFLSPAVEDSDDGPETIAVSHKHARQILGFRELTIGEILPVALAPSGSVYRHGDFARAAVE